MKVCSPNANKMGNAIDRLIETVAYRDDRQYNNTPRNIFFILYFFILTTYTALCDSVPFRQI